MYNWKKIILKQTDSMKSAIETLNDESLHAVMVVDNDKRLVGMVTDGDIRRGLLRHLSLSSPILDFMNKDPVVSSMEESKDDIFHKMKKIDILQIPIVDNDRRIVGFEMFNDLLEVTKHDNPIFIMAGGFGKRLRPLTNNMPKPLLKVGEQPILETILEQFISVGFHNFFISTHYKAEMVQEYFGNGSERNISIRYIHEAEPLGTAGALGLLPKDLPNLPIIMMNGDLLTKVDFEQLLSFHAEQGGDVTMCVREYDFQVPYGVIKSNGHRIISIKEKPIHKFFVNAGIYVLNPSIIDRVDGVSYLDVPQMLESIIEEEGEVNMFPMHEYWLDVGMIEGYNQANKEILTLFKK